MLVTASDAADAQRRVSGYLNDNRIEIVAVSSTEPGPLPLALGPVQLAVGGLTGHRAIEVSQTDISKQPAADAPAAPIEVQPQDLSQLPGMHATITAAATGTDQQMQAGESNPNMLGDGDVLISCRMNRRDVPSLVAAISDRAAGREAEVYKPAAPVAHDLTLGYAQPRNAGTNPSEQRAPSRIARIGPKARSNRPRQRP